MSEYRISFEEYIEHLVHLGGWDRNSAKMHAQKTYIKQWGKNPEEHQKELQKEFEKCWTKVQTEGGLKSIEVPFNPNKNSE